MDRRDAASGDALIAEDATPVPSADARPWGTDPSVCPEFAAPTCVGAECATSELAARYLELWWQVQHEMLDATAAEIAATLEVHAAEVNEGLESVFFRVTWVARVGWTSSMGVKVYPLGDYPLVPWPDDGAVLELLRRNQSCFHLPRYAIPFDEVGERIHDCFPKPVASACRIMAMDPPECILEGLFSTVVDVFAEVCWGGRLDLETGQVSFCGEYVCRPSTSIP